MSQRLGKRRFTSMWLLKIALKKWKRKCRECELGVSQMLPVSKK